MGHCVVILLCRWQRCLSPAYPHYTRDLRDVKPVLHKPVLAVSC
jgi:hypothetical protein